MSDERRPRIDHDTPPFSRLFVVCSKNHEKQDISNAFEEFGTLQDVWLVKDRATNENKGIAYIKFEKASDAHRAMEKLHGEAIGSDPKPLKVLLADSKGQNRSMTGEVKPRSRIFILVSKSSSTEEINEEFSQFGTVDHVQLLTDKSTGDSKGCAYVKFSQPSAAFYALEQCEEKYKAVIAEPRVPRNERNATAGSGYDARDNIGNRNADNSRRGGSYNQTYEAPQPTETMSFTDSTDPDGMKRLYIVCHTSLYEEQLYSLFDLVPGLESFELKFFRGSTESRGFAYALYSTVEQACYAKRKLDGLEYPPGHKLIVKYAEDKPQGRDRQGSTGADMDSSWNAASAGNNRRSVHLAARGPYINMNSSFNSTLDNSRNSTLDNSRNSSMNSGRDCPYTDVSLPKQQPLASPGTPCRAKLFIVATPTFPEEKALTDVFCRFSSLIDIKLIPGTSYGYIRYGIKESADAATMVMNDCKICGSTIKLSVQEEGGNDNKRGRVSLDSNTGWN